MPRLPRAAYLGLLGVVAASLVVPVGCGERYEPPCRVTARRVVRPAPEGAVAYGPVSLVDDAGGAGAFTVVSYLAPPVAVDGGVPEAGLGGLGGAPGALSLVVPRLRLLRLAATGEVTGTQELAAPSALAARRGSTVTVGASPVTGGALFHWIEVTSTTAPDGTPQTDAAVVLQRAGAEGDEGARVAPPELACTHCVIDVSFASLGDVTAALVTLAPDALTTAGGAVRRTQLVALDREGRLVAREYLDRLTAPVGAGPLGLRLSVQRGLFVARIERAVQVFDAALVTQAGPFALPTSEAEIDLDREGSVLTVVHSDASVPRPDGSVAPTYVGLAPDLLFEQLTEAGDALGGPRRFAASTTSLDVRRNGRRTGIVHSAPDGTFFSLVDDGGDKRGGDLTLAPAVGTPDLGAPGVFDRGVTRSRLEPAGNGFVVWTAGVDVVREEIACEP